MGKEHLFYAMCYSLGVFKLERWWRQRFRPGLIILNYHRASGGDLRRHLLYLRQRYRVIHLEQALEELYAAEEDKRTKRLRDRRTPLVVTFDDGYRDLYTHAFPLASELHVPITVFLIPGYIESGNCFWWHAGDLLVGQAQVDRVTIEGRTYGLGRQQEREALARAIYTRARFAGSVAEREAFLAEMREALAVPSPVVPREAEVLNWAEVREMEESGWVSFGAHTAHHPVLAYLKDPAEVQREVRECRNTLEARLGHPVRAFAYPIGHPEHISAEAIQAVAEAGYSWAVTTISGANTSRSDRRLLRRIQTDVERPWVFLAAETSGIRRWVLAYIRNWRLLRVRFARKGASASSQKRVSPGFEITGT